MFRTNKRIVGQSLSIKLTRRNYQVKNNKVATYFYFKSCVFEKNDFTCMSKRIGNNAQNFKYIKDIFVIGTENHRKYFNDCFCTARELCTTRKSYKLGIGFGFQNRYFSHLRKNYGIKNNSKNVKNNKHNGNTEYYENLKKIAKEEKNHNMENNSKNAEDTKHLQNSLQKESFNDLNEKQYMKSMRKPNELEEKYTFEKFSIFSFNILANSLVDEKYDQNNSDVMKWINRKKSIFLNVIKKQSDIICLQEVEEEYFEELKMKLEKFNYKGIYLKKKKESCKDGLCIFYNSKVFELLFMDKIVFDKTNVLKKWHVGLVVALKNLKTKKTHKHKEKKELSKHENNITSSNSSSSSGSSNGSSNDGTDNKDEGESSDDIIIVGNTHLLFDYYKGDVKLYQLCYLTYRIIIMLNRCVNYLKKKNQKTKSLYEQDFLKPCIVLCGDFNFTPNSLLYYFVINRFINLKNINLELISGQYLMFKKELYFTYCEQGKKIKNLFDEHIMGDLQNMQNKKATENVRKEALFLFFKNQYILKEKYIINMFHQKKNNLIDYDFFEHNFEKRKHMEDSQRACFQSTNGSEDNNMRNKNVINVFPIFPSKETLKETLKETDSEKYIETNKEDEDEDENENEDDEEEDISKNTTKWNEETAENEIKEVEENFILYYPLYFRSVYNHMCVDSRKKKNFYKYDTLDNLYNNKNNEIDKDLPFTVYHGKQKGCVDYIFYSYKNLDILSYSELPSFEKLSKWGCLPNKKYSSSDHLYLHAIMVRKN